MEKEIDINKTVRQHIEMENFFTGGFTTKAKTPEPKPQQQNTKASANAAAELEKIADEVRQCRKCDLGSLRTNAVPGEGNPRARILFVGEGPGADEDAQDLCHYQPDNSRQSPPVLRRQQRGV